MVIALCVTVGLVLFALWMWRPSWRRHPDRHVWEGQYVAHRGLHGLAPNTPENSMAAFRGALEHGLAIETDVHLSADGEVVLFHDDDLTRMCGVEGTPETSTLAELKQLRLAGTEETIPTLRELLELVNGAVPLLIEIKCRPGMPCAALCRAVDRLLSQYEGVYAIQSFYPPALWWYRWHHPNVFRGQLSAGFYKDKPHMRALGCLVFNWLSRPDFISYEHETVSHPCRRLCSRMGAYLFGWTFRTPGAVDKTQFCTYIFEGFIPETDKKKGEP